MRLMVLLGLVLGINSAHGAETIVLNSKNTMVLSSVVSQGSVGDLMVEASAKDLKLPSNQPIYIVLASPGGEIGAGIALIDYLNALHRPIHTITLFSASMSFHISQGLEKRYITKYGTMMSHKARGSFEGEFPGQLDSRYNAVLRLTRMLDQRAVFRTKGKHTMASYAALIENEYWCTGKDCIAQGFADAIADAKCDKSLSGAVEETFEVAAFGMPVAVKLIKARCPLNQAILGASATIQGHQVYPAIDYDSFSNINSGILGEINRNIKEQIEGGKL